MSNIYKGTLGLIGNTPLVEAVNIEKELGLETRILLKLEYFNPAGSVKDRIAKAMIEDAEEKGVLRDELCGQYNPYAKLFSPQRMNFRAGTGNLFTDIGESVRGLARGWLGKDSIQCTHMGCGLTWNEDEKTWECSCHGSRFDAHGKLLDNPAKKDIQ